VTDKPILRDTVVLGASAGGVEALKRLLSVFPPSLPASVFIVLHVAAEGDRSLASILDRSTPLKVVFAEDGMATRYGCVYLAPPDRHLTLSDGHVSVVFGPRENRCRPAIDPLFRSAAVHRRARVIGVILTGLLDDGAQGLLAVKRCGGLALIQTPDDAHAPAMPRHAAETLGASLDGSHGAEELGRRIVHAIGERTAPPPPVPPELAIEQAMLTRTASPTQLEELGELVPMTCPECGGPLSAVGAREHKHYRCFTGHAFTARTLLSSQHERVERALWAAMRSLEERGNTLLVLAGESRKNSRTQAAASFEVEAVQLREHAGTIRRILLDQHPAGD